MAEEVQGVNYIRRIPPELIAIVVDYVGLAEPFYSDRAVRRTLGNLRVFRIFREEAARVMFHEFVYRIHMDPTQWSYRGEFKFGRYVKKLLVTTIEYDYEDWDMEGFSTRLDKSCDDDHPLNDQDHYDQAFEVYTEFRNDHLDLLAGDECLAQLTHLLSSMPNVEQVVLTGDRCSIYDLDDTYQEAYCECQLSGCSVASKEHEILTVTPRAGLTDLGSEHFLMLMSALLTAQLPVKELVVASRDYPGDGDTALDYEILDLPPIQMARTMAVFSHFTKLELEITADYLGHMGLDLLNGDTRNSSPIARLISHAKDLTHLRLTFKVVDISGEWGDFESVMFGCVLPKLKSCNLTAWNFHPRTLLDFIQHSPGLTQLKLKNCPIIHADISHVRKRLHRLLPHLTYEQMTRNELGSQWETINGGSWICEGRLRRSDIFRWNRE
ncbi:MAG: hypothetical protein Q9192_008096 [Flavoplaca navasiana]